VERFNAASRPSDVKRFAARTLLLTTILVCLLATAGCGRDSGAAGGLTEQVSTSASEPPMPTSCGLPYRFEIGHRVVVVGSCSGILPTRATDVTAYVGERFSVAIIREQNGRFDYPIPTPDGSSVRIVEHNQAGVTYVARSVGITVLLAKNTPFCSATDGVSKTPSSSTCPTLRVKVRP
jgi:hypothetical protein